MKATCAWCKADMGERPGPAHLVTHGICPACSARLMPQAKGGEA